MVPVAYIVVAVTVAAIVVPCLIAYAHNAGRHAERFEVEQMLWDMSAEATSAKKIVAYNRAAAAVRDRSTS